MFKEETLTHWQPQLGEWCWFWNVLNGAYEIPVLRKFVKMTEEGFYLADNIVCDWAYTNCEPFIGELPSFIKEHLCDV
jgi:hypothetical protein